MIKLSQHDASDWVYLAEGNANIVLKYVGKSPKLVGHVLRLSKIKSTNKEEELLDHEFIKQFSQKIIGKLIGQHYINDMIQIQVDESFITTIEKKIHDNRCMKRRTELLHQPSIGFLMKDMTLNYAPNDTWTFEIKPKWGFLPNSKWIDKQHQQLKMEKCRFCMHQRLRNKKNAHEEKEEDYYCPLDLYSGDPKRMKHAIIASLKKTHSYLKLFYNGEFILQPERINDLALFNNNNEDNEEGNNMTNDMILSKIANLLVTILLKDTILKRLKHLQQSLDAIDIEGIYLFYQRFNYHHFKSTYDLHFWKNVVENFLIRQSQNSETKGTNLDDDSIQRIGEYLLSMTLKDCSIMISVMKNKVENKQSKDLNTVTINEDQFHYHIKLVDIDMKKWSKIPYWFELDRQIIKYNLQLSCDRKCLN
ncbi:unnamed protein product [Cunninghamella blakesleeana]